MKSKSTTNNKKGEPAMDTSEMSTAERIADGKSIVLANTEYDRLTGERQDTELVDALGTIAHYTERYLTTPRDVALAILNDTAKENGTTYSEKELADKITSVQQNVTKLARAWHLNPDAKIQTTTKFSNSWLVLDEAGDYSNNEADRVCMVELPLCRTRSMTNKFALLRYTANGGKKVSTRRETDENITWDIKEQVKDGVKTGKKFVDTFSMPHQCFVGVIASYPTLEQAIDCLDELSDALNVLNRICKEVKTAQNDQPEWEKEALAHDALDKLVAERAKKAPTEPVW